MRLINNINALYNKAHFISSHKGLVSIYEPSNADTKQVDVNKAGVDFFLLNQSFYKTQTNITTDKSNLFHDSDCDGVIFYEENGQQNILTVELKSGFSGHEIQKGYKQIYFTLLKLYSLLSICDDFDFSNYQITAYLACQPVKDKNEESKILQRLSEKQMAGDTLTITDKIMQNHLLANNKVVKCKIRDNGLTNLVLKQNLSTDILDQTITYRLFTMPYLNAHHGTLTLP